jgi:hypothetical protein
LKSISGAASASPETFISRGFPKQGASITRNAAASPEGVDICQTGSFLSHLNDLVITSITCTDKNFSLRRNTNISQSSELIEKKITGLCYRSIRIIKF